MRGHFSGVRAAVVGVAALLGLVLGSALAASISSFTPTSGLPRQGHRRACPGGDAISGTGFVSDNSTVVAGSPTGVVKVTFGGIAASYAVVGSNTTLYAVVPNGAATGDRGHDRRGHGDGTRHVLRQPVPAGLVEAGACRQHERRGRLDADHLQGQADVGRGRGDGRHHGQQHAARAGRLLRERNRREGEVHDLDADAHHRDRAEGRRPGRSS